MTTLAYFLGGRDLEMLEIRKLLSAARVHNQGLPWGAQASSYREEIDAELAQGHRPVLVELHDDLSLDGIPLVPLDASQPLPTVPPQTPGVLTVDHHGRTERSYVPTSLEQIFFLCRGQWPYLDEGEPNPQAITAGWTRHHDLVAANDRGHVRAMLELRPPATQEEMLEIRVAERQTLGITLDEEAAAQRAIRAREELDGGLLTIVRLAGDRVSAATDQMEPLLGGPGYRNLLVLSPNEYNFFGRPRIIDTLEAAFPGGFRGARFWGRERQGVTVDALRDCILAAAKAHGNAGMGANPLGLEAPPRALARSKPFRS